MATIIVVEFWLSFFPLTWRFPVYVNFYFLGSKLSLETVLINKPKNVFLMSKIHVFILCIYFFPSEIMSADTTVYCLACQFLNSSVWLSSRHKIGDIDVYIHIFWKDSHNLLRDACLGSSKPPMKNEFICGFFSSFYVQFLNTCWV